MLQHSPPAIQGAMIATTGIIAQVSPMVPEDFKSWPITAILGLITLVCLAIVAYQIRGSIKTAESLAKVAEKQTAADTQIRELTGEIRQLVLEMRGRPCINHNR
jgi:uncharacterized membrane protein